MSPEQHLSPQRKEILRQFVQDADKHRNGTVVARMIADASRLFDINPIKEIENILREAKSDTYLIALPMTDDDKDKFDSMMPNSMTETYPFYLMICVNGEKEAKAVMMEHELDPRQNLANLEQTGVLVPKEDTPLSRATQAPLN